MSDAEKIAELFFKHNLGALSESEQQELKEFVDASKGNQLEFEQYADSEGMQHFLDYREKMQLEFFGETSSGKYISGKVIFMRRGWVRVSAAASVLILLGLSLWLLFGDINQKSNNQIEQQEQITDVGPGSQKGVLRLSDGRQIFLDSAGIGLLAQQGNTSIYNKDGQLTYDAAGNGSKEILYNTLETATAQTYTLKLPDGTVAWLNATSSLKYPVSFTGNERTVEMQGEVFFEVAKNAKKPFKVKINTPTGQGSEIVVLGTQFNVNAYTDEQSIKTTLVEGKVRISSPSFGGGQGAALLPGQQARLDGNNLVVSDVDIAPVIAWKNQEFYFKSFDVKNIMRMLSRWYGVEVEYKDSIPADLTFSSVISRNTNLSSVLKMLELKNLHFKIEGKKVIVSR